MLKEKSSSGSLKVNYDTGWVTSKHTASTNTYHVNQLEVSPGGKRLGVIAMVRFKLGQDELGNYAADPAIDSDDIRVELISPESISGDNFIGIRRVRLDGTVEAHIASTADLFSRSDFAYIGGSNAEYELSDGSFMACPPLFPDALSPYKVSLVTASPITTSYTLQYRLKLVELED